MKEHPADHAAARIHDHAAELLDEARSSGSRRAARTMIGGNALRVTMIAIAAEAELAEHSSPSGASLQLLTGDAVLVAGEREWQLQAGTLLAIPPQRHSVLANSDSVLLLTVAVT